MLRCVRADGSATWQKQESRHAAFFALHDLTHFAVESTLGFQRGFFGLIAQGWEIEETTGKQARGCSAKRSGALDSGLAPKFGRLRISIRIWRIIWRIAGNCGG